ANDDFVQAPIVNFTNLGFYSTNGAVYWTLPRYAMNHYSITMFLLDATKALIEHPFEDAEEGNLWAQADVIVRDPNWAPIVINSAEFDANYGSGLYLGYEKCLSPVEINNATFGGKQVTNELIHFNSSNRCPYPAVFARNLLWNEVDHIPLTNKPENVRILAG